MILLGVDPGPTGTLAVFADEHGRVLSRGMHPTVEAALAATHVGRRPATAGVVGSPPDGTAPQTTMVSRAAAVALAEAWAGAARGKRHVVALTLDAHIHAGIVIDGRPFGGAHGLAGTASWLALNPVERNDYRAVGCLEAEIGDASIVRRLVWRVKAGDRSIVAEMNRGDLAAITSRQIFAAARSGDGVAISVVRDTARYIGMAIANFITILDPDVVVLGGTIADAADLLLHPAETEMAKRVPLAASRQVSIAAAALGADAAALGAARAASLTAPAATRPRRRR